MGLALTMSKDNRDIGLRDAKAFRNLGLRHGAVQLPNFADFFSAEKFPEESDSADVDRVLSIELVSGPLKIGGDIIGFVAVDVVDDRKIGGIGNKCQTNQSVDMDGFNFSIPEKVDVSVTELVRAGTENLSVNSARLQAVADAIEAAYSAEIADLVIFSEVRDRNGSPFFSESDIHMTGCPSGNGGLAIKSPSYVQACGGLAFMAPASNFYNTLQ